jgi:hypothetical protein
MTCTLSADRGHPMMVCRIDPAATAIAEMRRVEAELLADELAELLGLVELEDEHEEGEDGCDWQRDGDDERWVGDGLTEVTAAWFDADLDDEAPP